RDCVDTFTCSVLPTWACEWHWKNSRGSCTPVDFECHPQSPCPLPRRAARTHSSPNTFLGNVVSVRGVAICRTTTVAVNEDDARNLFSVSWTIALAFLASPALLN
ncbi:unnamed protein product, partial [Tenebrio molitor]